MPHSYPTLSQRRGGRRRGSERRAWKHLAALLLLGDRVLDELVGLLGEVVESLLGRLLLAEGRLEHARQQREADRRGARAAAEADHDLSEGQPDLLVLVRDLAPERLARRRHAELQRH